MRWLLPSVWLLVAACGGGDASPPPVEVGQFVEAQVRANADAARSPTMRSHPKESTPSPPVEELVSALDDPDPSVREDAIETLGDRGDAEGIPGLQRALYSEYDWLKLSAIEALADIGTDEAAMALGPLLSDDDSDVREAVVDALADIGTGAARGYVDQALSDSNSHVRATASEALAEFFYDVD